MFLEFSGEEGLLRGEFLYILIVSERACFGELSVYFWFWRVLGIDILRRILGVLVFSGKVLVF